MKLVTKINSFSEYSDRSFFIHLLSLLSKVTDNNVGYEQEALLGNETCLLALHRFLIYT